MALSVNGGGFGSRRRGASSSLSEINVTPFVDVVLVLLIIFMLTAHVMEFGIEVDVPKVRPVKENAREMPVVSITKDGTTWLNDKPVNINDLPATIRQRYGKTKGVYIRADKQTIWEMVAQVTAEMGDAGFVVNMVTQPEDSTAKGEQAMTRQLDILDQPEPLKKWLMGSLFLHAALTAGLVSFNAMDHHSIQLGDPHGGGFGSVQVNTVHTIALPGTSGPTNPVASNTKSLVPTPPPTQAKPKPAAPAKDLDAIAIKSRLAEKKPSPSYSEQNKFAAARKDLPNQAYTSVPQQVSNPMYQMAGGGGVGVGNNSPFGTMYGEYANRLRDQVARNWKTTDIPPQIRTAPLATITFTLHRDGTVSNVRITGRSGNAALDYSAQRAILDAAPFPPLPAGFPKNDPEIEFLFELKR